MKKLHVHTKVKDLNESIEFYTTLFNQEPKVVKEDYAKWDLDSPSINFAVSPSSGNWGVSHLGIENSSDEELKEVYAQMDQTKQSVREEGETICCYHRSEKAWIADPQGVEWEMFRTFEEADKMENTPVTKKEEGVCCTPKEETEAKGACC
jgi:catechol 2,3-dioxygenase-like lactoylglutathione lyase family enzyme